MLPDGGSLCSAGKDGRVVVWGGAGGIAHLEAVVEMDLADVLRESAAEQQLALVDAGI